MRRKMAECLVDLVAYRIDVPNRFSGYKSVCLKKIYNRIKMATTIIAKNYDKKII
jgi:hypothetical protein